jgi:hypothetical protein
VDRVATEATAQKAVTEATEAKIQSTLAARRAGYAAALARANGQALSGHAGQISGLKTTTDTLVRGQKGMGSDLSAHSKAFSAFEARMRAQMKVPLNVRYFKSGRSIGSAVVTPAP